MAHPIFKPDSNVNYDATMLGGPYGDNDSKGSIQGKYGPQWKYLVRIGETPHYWYATPHTNEMIEKMGYNAPGSPFTILKRVEDGKNKGFELSGESYDVIFPKEQPGEEAAPPEQPMSTEQQASLDEHIAQGAPTGSDTVSIQVDPIVTRLDKIGRLVVGMEEKIDGMREDLEWIRKNTVPF